QDEAPLALQAAKGLALHNALQEVAGAQTGAVRSILLTEAKVAFDVARAEFAQSGFGSPRYVTSSGGVDVGRRLADVRNEHPDLVGIDPTRSLVAGDRASRRASLVLGAGIPLGVA